MDYSKELFSLCFESIASVDLKMLLKTLELMNIERLNANESSQLLETLLQVCLKNNKPECIDTIRDQWELKVHPTYEDLDFFESLFFDRVISQSSINFLAQNLNDYSFLEIAQDISSEDRGETSREAAMRLYNAYPGVSLDNVKVVLEYLSGVGNNSMFMYFESVLDEKSDFAEIPSWVDNRMIMVPTDDELMRVKEKYKMKDRSESEIIELMIERAMNNPNFVIKITRDELREKIIKSLPKDSESRQIKLREELHKLDLDGLQDNKELFRIYGPPHPGFNYSVDQLELGGPRMLMNGEWDYDEDNQLVDWFLSKNNDEKTGNCFQCHLKIRKYFHAIRRPHFSGGWIECFCSIPCLRRRQENLECDAETQDLYSRELIDLLEKKLNDIGIQDRI